VYLESYSGYLNYGWSQLAGWVGAEGKYLHSSAPEFYALGDDPRELHDVIAKHADDVQSAQRAIGELTTLSALDAAAPHTSELDRDLRRLGYGAGGPLHDALPHPLAPSDRKSPRASSGELEPLLVANALGESRHYEDAVPVLQKILAANPAHVLAMDLCAFDLMQLGRFEDAQTLLVRRLALPPRRADTLINLATCRERLGRGSEARTLYERAIEIDRESAQALEALVRLAEAAGDQADAQRWRTRLEALAHERSGG
jgi:tetratricopeptide (TPR) repeat protein